MQRREFLQKSSFLAAAAGLVAGGTGSVQADAPKTASTYAGKEGLVWTKESKHWGLDPVEHFTAYYPDFSDNNIWIRQDNQVLAAYRTQKDQKYPYIYPLTGPVSRVSVTSESAMPWPHHRSVFLGLDRVNGGNYWQQTRADGQILSQDPQIVRAEKNLIEFTDRCLWKKPDQDPIIEDTRKYLLEWRCSDYYILDLEYSMTMLTDVQVQKTNHGFFGVRVEQDLAPDGGGHMLSSEGATCQKDSLAKPANWIAFYGNRRFNPAISEGVAVFSPPNEPFGSPFDKTPWFTRDYGNISPMPFLFVDKDFIFKWEKGKKISTKYRVVVFAGTPADVDLTKLWNEFYK